MRGTIRGLVLAVDRFGNLVTNIPREWVERLGAVRCTVADRAVGALVTTYGEMPAGTVCALFGSSNRLEIALRGGSAAEHLGLARGAAVEVRGILQ